MKTICPICNSTTLFEEHPPKFCSHCGGRLDPSADIEATDGLDKPAESIGTGATGNSHEAAGSAAAAGPANSSASQQHSATDETLPPRGPSGSTSSLVYESGEEHVLGQHVGPYLLESELGRGGMGVVYKASHRLTGQGVALKLINAGSAGNQRAAERFRRETLIAASISNPRSTFVYDSGEHQGRRYIAMELMPGGSLKELVLERGPLPVSQAVDLILDVIEGIQSAHRKGIVHRDIKPSNCFVDHDGRVKVGDYGLSKTFDNDVSLTQTGAFMGTPQYAAPEQVRAGAVDERTDIYAIGATLFYMLTARGPFEGDLAQVIAAIVSERPDSVRRFAPQVPKGLAGLIAQMLEKDPRSRPPTLSEVRKRLLPYATQGATAADVGRRLAAYFVDSWFVYFVLYSPLFLITIWLFLGMDWQNQIGQSNFSKWALGVINFLIHIGYFSVTEGLWGRGLGKWLVGMRVVDERGTPPA